MHELKKIFILLFTFMLKKFIVLPKIIINNHCTKLLLLVKTIVRSQYPILKCWDLVVIKYPNPMLEPVIDSKVHLMH